MCGIIGINSNKPVSATIINSLKKLEYRGYDSAGIATLSSGLINEIKSEGRVDNLEKNSLVQNMEGTIGIGHVRYPTAGSSSRSEAQPFYVNSPYGLGLAHNGNLTNASQLHVQLTDNHHRHMNTTSDSELLPVSYTHLTLPTKRIV